MRTYRSRHPIRRALADLLPRMEPVDWALAAASAAIMAALAAAYLALARLLGVA